MIALYLCVVVGGALAVGAYIRTRTWAEQHRLIVEANDHER